MPEVSIEIEVYCSCGEGLCGQSTGGSGHRGEPVITVEPCEKCLERARDEGYDVGFAEGGIKMRLPDMLWTRSVLDMVRNKDVDGLLKKGFYVICFKKGHVNMQGDLENVGISEAEFAEYKYIQTTSAARFYDYTWRGVCITLCTPSSINSADTDIESAFEQREKEERT